VCSCRGLEAGEIIHKEKLKPMRDLAAPLQIIGSVEILYNTNDNLRTIYHYYMQYYMQLFLKPFPFPTFLNSWPDK